MSVLTKSDFKACAECPTRLHYRKSGFPSTKDEDEYLQFLADGGFMIELVAKSQFPGAHDLTPIRDPAEAFTRTRELLAAHDRVTIFEAAANHDRYHARIDVLAKEGRVLRLIEVKSSSVSTADEEEHEDDGNDAQSPLLNKKGIAVYARWRPYVEDVAFQTIVLERAFPEFEVKPYLCVVDKAHVVSEAETLHKFKLVPGRPAPNGKRPRPEVRYLGDPAALSGTRLLATLDARAAVELVRAEVETSARLLASLLVAGGAERHTADIAAMYKVCRTCEFRTDVRERSGFRECWGPLASSSAHVLDLHRVGQIGSKDFPDPVPDLLARGSASYLDLTVEQLGKPGAYATRRLLQWEGTRSGRPYQAPGLRDTLTAHYASPGYPLHFIDFEACNLSLPHHAGLHPYERVAFQWSCHTVGPDGKVTHGEWLNERLDFPNFTFARTLRERLGETGTVYVWSNYEQTTLRKVLEQLLDADGRKLGRPDPDLAAWIDRLLGPPDAEGKRRNSPRIRDLHDLTYAHYFHPGMGGRTSIKVVLPSVWASDPQLQSHPCFREYLGRDATGAILDPYQTLPVLPLGGIEQAVREGTGAVRIYQDMLFDADAKDRESRLKLLKQYCRLDTAAMLMIWAHWLGRYDLVPAADTNR